MSPPRITAILPVLLRPDDARQAPRSPLLHGDTALPLPTTGDTPAPGAASASAPAPDGSGTRVTGAMQPDQTVMLRMNWAIPDAHRLACNWNVVIQARLTAAQQGNGPRLAVSVGADTAGALLPVSLAVPVHAWAGLPILLWFRPPRSAPRATRRPKKPEQAVYNGDDTAWELGLLGDVPGMGRLSLGATFSSQGVDLLVTVQTPSAWQRLRQGRPRLSNAVHRAGWTLRACQFVHEPKEAHDAHLPAILTQPTVGMRPDSRGEPSPLPPLTLLQGLAEVLIALGRLAQCQPDINPASR